MPFCPGLPRARFPYNGQTYPCPAARAQDLECSRKCEQYLNTLCKQFTQHHLPEEKICYIVNRIHPEETQGM